MLAITRYVLFMTVFFYFSEALDTDQLVGKLDLLKGTGYADKLKGLVEKYKVEDNMPAVAAFLPESLKKKAPTPEELMARRAESLRNIKSVEELKLTPDEREAILKGTTVLLRRKDIQENLKQLTEDPALKAGFKKAMRDPKVRNNVESLAKQGYNQLTEKERMQLLKASLLPLEMEKK